MKLYGSVPSPYVRRIRMLLANVDFEFVDMQIFTPDDRALLTSINPILKVPMFTDGDDVIFDSRVIFRYLAEKYELPKLSWHEENLLSVIDGINDSIVQMFILKRSDIDVTEDRLYFNIQNERISQSFDFLVKALAEGDFDQWHYPAICLYSLLDWALFRELMTLDAYPTLVEFMAANKERAEVTATDPRN